MSDFPDLQVKEISRQALDEDAPAAARTLLAFWHDHAQSGILPTRDVFCPAKLTPWIDDLSIYEYKPDKNDFQILLEGENIIAITGEDWRGAFAREIDCHFSTSLHAAMSMARVTCAPQIHHLLVFQKDWQEAVRLLLPVLLQKPGREDVVQVFLAIFPLPQTIL